MPSDPHPPLGIDVSVPNVARMYDYWLGGKYNYAADREGAERLLTAAPGGRAMVESQRGFVIRATEYLAGVVRLGQFLDLGSGLPTAENVHEVAQRVRPGARVVYVDNDPVAVAHGEAILTGDDNTTYVLADARDVGIVLDHAKTSRLLDFDRPIGLIMSGLLPYCSNADDPAAVVAEYASRLAPGSRIAFTHPVVDGSDPGVLETMIGMFKRSSAPVYVRSRAEVAAMAGGLRWDEPGLVDAQKWRADEPTMQIRNVAGVVRVG